MTNDPRVPGCGHQQNSPPGAPGPPYAGEPLPAGFCDHDALVVLSGSVEMNPNGRQLGVLPVG